MEIKEVVEIIGKEKACVERGGNCNRKCDECDLVMDAEKILEAYDTTIKALEKQIPTKPMLRRKKRFDGYNDGWCTCCNWYVKDIFDRYNYCPNCGQALDWEGVK